MLISAADLRLYGKPELDELLKSATYLMPTTGRLQPVRQRFFLLLWAKFSQ